MHRHHISLAPVSRGNVGHTVQCVLGVNILGACNAQLLSSHSTLVG